MIVTKYDILYEDIKRLVIHTPDFFKVIFKLNEAIIMANKYMKIKDVMENYGYKIIDKDNTIKSIMEIIYEV